MEALRNLSKRIVYTILQWCGSKNKEGKETITATLIGCREECSNADLGSTGFFLCRLNIGI